MRSVDQIPPPIKLGLQSRRWTDQIRAAIKMLDMRFADRIKDKDGNYKAVPNPVLMRIYGDSAFSYVEVGDSPGLKLLPVIF